jgi:hypothetical protein
VRHRAQLALDWMKWPPKYEEKTESFDHDPAWEGVNNRPAESTLRTVRQEFGYSNTAHAGRKAGEIGGFIMPDGAPAYIARKIPVKSFDDPLTASGALSCTTGKFHVLIAFFNSRTLNEWRTPNTVALRLIGRGPYFYAYLEYCTNKWRAGGDSPQGFTIRDPATGKSRPIEFAVNGTPHTWSIRYDPTANNGAGSITATIDNHTAICNLEPDHRQDSATFNRFGLLNVIKSVDDGGEVWLDDVEVNGEVEHFDKDPGWEVVGNRRTYKSAEVRPRFDFGFSRTHFAGGKSSGELGGLFFRGDGRYREKMAWYADRVSPLTLQGDLRASGKIAMCRGVSDSTTLLGFFNSTTSTSIRDAQDTAVPDDFLGIAIEGPSSDGFFVYPIFRVAGQSRSSYGDKSNNRILPNGATHNFSLQYSPNEPGRLTVKLDNQSISLDLGPLRNANARFDRFGILTTRIDGNAQRVYFDDLTYTVGQD